MRRFAILAGLAAAFASLLFAAAAVSQAQHSALTPLPAAAEMRPVLDAVAAAGLTGVVLWEQRSFVLSMDGVRRTIVSGKGRNREQVDVCFIAVTGPQEHPKIIRTIGEGDYDTTSCRGVDEVALVGAPARLLVIFDSVSPNYSVREPVVFRFPVGGPPSIDRDASRQLSLAGVTSAEAAATILDR